MEQLLRKRLAEACPIHSQLHSLHPLRHVLQWKPRSKRDEDESLGSLVSRRLGGEALDALVAPLLSGLHAGDAYRLSTEGTFPELRAWERAHGSLIRGARASLKGGARASERTEESERRAKEAARTGSTSLTRPSASST